jgi:transcriptional regulator with XRE-family HTH domain
MAPPRTAAIGEAANRHAAFCLRAMRRAAGLTQAQAAEALGVSYQQIHKYESGANRLSCGHLAAFAAIFGCHPADFFADAAPALDPALRRRLARLSPRQLDLLLDALAALDPAALPAAPGGHRSPTLPATAGEEARPGTRPMGPGAAGETAPVMPEPGARSEA